MRPFPICLLYLLLVGATLQGQYWYDNYKFITTADGLPSRYANDLAEDQYGFIWIATSGGLVRYDGSMVNRLSRVVGDSVHLASNNVRSLLAVRDSLWIGTSRGLSILNLQTGRIVNHPLEYHHFPRKVDAADEDFKTAITDIYEDRQGNIWLTPGFGGFVKWEKNTGSFVAFPLYPDERLPANYTHGFQTSLVAVSQDAQMDSIVWGAGRVGLHRLNQETGTITRIMYEQGSAVDQHNVNRKICMYQDPATSLIYTGAWGGGLSVYDPVSGTYDWLSKQSSEYFASHIEYNMGHLLEIVPAGSDKLYMTYANGLYLYDCSERNVELVRLQIEKGYKQFFGVDFVDSEGRIWDANGLGVTVIDPVEHQFKKYSVAGLNTSPLELIPRAIVEDFLPGYITLGGQFGDGIYHVNLTTGDRVKLDAMHVSENKRFFSISGMTPLNDEELLIAAAKQLYVYRKSTNRLIPYTVQLPPDYSRVNQVLKDDFGQIWVGTAINGVVLIDEQQKKILNTDEAVPSYAVTNPFQDSKKNIWMLTNYGHLVFNREQDQFNFFDYNRDSSKTFLTTRPFCECPNGEVWMPGESEGIGLLSATAPEKGILRKIVVKDRYGKAVKASRVACSPDNELWLMNSGSIMKVDRTNWTCETYSTEYGVKQWHGMFQFLKNGELFIASRDAFYTVDPNQLRSNDRLPRPYVASITSNKGAKNRFEDHLKEVPVYLSASENVFTIEFSAINHSLAHKTTYQYKLEGADEEWADPGTKRSLTYSYLPGGDYIFQLRAANNEGIWNDDIYELPIYVGTPWYKTTFFRVGLIGILLGLGWLYNRARIRQVRREEQLKADFDRQRADLEMSALRAQMNPHFIFNCLNSIEAYMIRNDKKQASIYLNTFSRLIRLILQNSRTSYVSLIDELEALELYIQLEQMRLKHKFDYEIILADGLKPEDYEIPPMLIQPLVENAIWHGLQYLESDGKVTIRLEAGEEHLECVVTDNGIGREAAAGMKAAKKVKRKSMATQITGERIRIINEIYATKNEIVIDDLYDAAGMACGTRVRLLIPL